jgi:hypothetical protein
MKTLPLLTLTFLLGCNSLGDHIEQQVDSKVGTAKQDMNAEVEKSKGDFIAAYHATEKSNDDKLVLQKLQTFKAAIATTDNYLDSLKTEMDKLDEMDVHNVELVKSAFLYKGAGDSIINKLNNTIATAQAVAKTEGQKAAIKVSSDSLGIAPSPDKWKEQTFGMTNPLGASMILYGLRIALYNIGMKALADE